MVLPNSKIAGWFADAPAAWRKDAPENPLLDLRVVAATEVDPDRPGSNFRAALRFRLGAIELRLAAVLDRHELGVSVIERREDIGLLAAAALERTARQAGGHWDGGGARRGATARWARCFEALLLADWPGNVRELMHRVRRLQRDADVDRDAAALEVPGAVGSPPAAQAERPGVQEQAAPQRPLQALSDAEFLGHWRRCAYEVARVARAPSSKNPTHPCER